MAPKAASNQPMEENVVESCPICGRDLAGTSDEDVSSHVNACLDEEIVPQIAPASLAIGKDREIDAKPKFKIFTIPHHAEFASDLSNNGIDHDPVHCDGPLCVANPLPIKGVRYKCTVCEDVDFCSSCIMSAHDKHDKTHAMVECTVPMAFKLFASMDDDAKRNLLRESGHTNPDPNIILHMLYAVTRYSRHLQVAEVSKQDKAIQAALQVPEQKPIIFLILKPSLPRSDLPSHPTIEEIEKADGDDYVSVYDIDQQGKVTVRRRDIGKASNITSSKSTVHSSPDIIMKVITGQLSAYVYPTKDKFYRDAHAGKPATRVIDIQPGVFEDKLECELRPIDLLDNIIYEALSYTWKETAYQRANHVNWTPEVDATFRSMIQLSHPVYIGDKFLEINVGLRDALRRIRHPTDAKTFWVDQLCIDQSNASERAYQVQSMRRIYNRAQQVVLWTGDGDGHTAAAFNMIRMLSSALLHYGPPNLPTLEELQADSEVPLPEIGSVAWQSLANFFLRPVFGRVWVIQEIVTARRLLVRCGDETVDWEELAAAAELLSTPSFIISLRHLQSYDIIQQAQAKGQFFLAHVTILKRIRSDFHVLKEQSLQSLLYSTCIFEATDPKDIVFAKLGLLSAQRDPSDIAEIRVDYERSTSDVFLEATTAIMQKEQSFALWGLITSTPHSPNAVLPSWVPNFAHANTAADFAFNRPDPPCPYTASGDSEFMAIWPFEKRPELLVVTSSRVDRVKAVASDVLKPNASVAKHIQEWTGMVEVREGYYRTGDFAADSFTNACVANCSAYARTSPAPKRYHASLSAFFYNEYMKHLAEVNGLSSLDDLDDLVHDWPPNRLLATLFSDSLNAEEVAESNEAASIEAMLSFRMTCTNRRFFVTEGSLMGFGPIDVQVGDELHVISGAETPFILRHDEKSMLLELPEEYDMEQKPFTLIGEAYVQGLMEGEALAREDFEWDGICIS